MKSPTSDRYAESPPETSPRGKTLPTEVLHRIVSHALAAHFADVIDGPHALNVDNYPDAICSFETVYERETHAMTVGMERTGVCTSPVVQLLRVSYVVRHVTLEVVAKVFNIRYISKGLGGLEGTRPWRKLSKCRYDVWSITKGGRVPSALTDDPSELRAPPVLDVYLALASVRREVDLTWKFVNSAHAEFRGEPRHLYPLGLTDVPRWMEHATRRFQECLEVFREGLSPRISEALEHAVVNVFTAHMRALERTWKRLKNTHRAPYNAPGYDDQQLTLERLRTWIFTMLRSLADMLASLDRMWTLIPQTESVDKIIGPRKYRTLIRTLDEIREWAAEDLIFGPCRDEARALRGVFYRRLHALVFNESLLA
ncbi:hypothetical protein PsYK624_119070 [Phanerochaete sordida]|uniref:Uncharacterized protein n=1 Tax=Phanerochaete sordida TaxID=48140 RepID=A0A9P3GIR9_9APHY|nr:hypothetical protein PsYK624_119070 [Phanerochaete sordida]